MTLEDILTLRDLTIKTYVGLPARIRLWGAERDLTEEEIRTLAQYQAVVMLLTSKGISCKQLNPVFDEN